MIYYIEKAKDKRTEDGSCSISDVVKATQEEIDLYKSKSCDHSVQNLLIYDEPSFAWDIRKCGVCDSVIGLI